MFVTTGSKMNYCMNSVTVTPMSEDLQSRITATVTSGIKFGYLDKVIFVSYISRKVFVPDIRVCLSRVKMR